MAVYVSLIPKYKFSQAKRFLVKPNAKLCPSSDSVSQAGSQRRKFLYGRKLEVVKHPWVGWGITCECSLLCLRLHQGSFPSLATISGGEHWVLPTPQGRSGDGFVCVRFPKAELMTPLCPGPVGQGMSTMGSQGLPVSQVPVVFYCSTAHTPGKGAKFMLNWIQSAAFWCSCSSSTRGSCRCF